MGRGVVPGTALLEAASAAARLLLPAERAADAALAGVSIVAPLMLGGQVQHKIPDQRVECHVHMCTQWPSRNAQQFP
jgi:hypothetical protein